MSYNARKRKADDVIGRNMTIFMESLSQPRSGTFSFIPRKVFHVQVNQILYQSY
ncbi:hypothetical protein RhiirA5_350313 [Rhizophagus irregularis]|uniref:Uncharacterized protein n=1 Tax=Rhizophagus irregularis TaxID=588596 RepID=A0A2N0Q5X6_9GLOM|nr:hypothetical protein RhiirA5_350313 [Rhizophagus irregularis]